jgi:hypothetical protein
MALTGTILEYQRRVATQTEELCDGKGMEQVCKWIVFNLAIAALIEEEHARGTCPFACAMLVYARIEGESAVHVLQQELMEKPEE